MPLVSSGSPSSTGTSTCSFKNTGGLWVGLARRVVYLTYDAGHLTERDCLVPRDDVGLRLEAEFAAQWTPPFRRGCWLCGCDIEASADEKAEWVREFTKEEIESWKLKI